MTDFGPYDRQSFERDIEQTVVSDMGAMLPGEWHARQCAAMSGLMSR